MNFKKIMFITATFAVCLSPVKTQAAEVNLLKNNNEVLSLVLAEVADVKDGEQKSPWKFTNEQPAIQVEPIENVEDYLPDQIYPQEITTGEILDLISPKVDTYTVVDLETGKTFDCVRYGGNKHLDSEPKTAADAETISSLENNSWNRRAIAVYFEGEFYAASMHTMPHGNGHVKDNGYNGHFCIHVLESKTHGSNRVCELHQGRIQEAIATDITDTATAVMAQKG